MDIVLGIIAALSPILIAWFGYYFKIRLKKIEINTDTNKRLVSLENTVLEIKSTLNRFISDNKFRIEFKNTIRNKSRNLHSLYNGVLSDESRDAILKWAELIEKFGLDFYYSEARKQNEKQRRAYLSSVLNAYKKDFYRHLEVSHKGIKRFNHTNILISGLLREKNIHSKTEFLKVTLVKNGLTPDATIKLFEDYITDFSQDLSRVFQTWDSLNLIKE